MAVAGFHEAMQSLHEGAREANRDANRDIDETRRLLYMALFAPKTKRYNLAASLVNAMRHHQGIDEEGMEEKILALVDGAQDADTEWARQHIARLGR